MQAQLKTVVEVLSPHTLIIDDHCLRAFRANVKASSVRKLSVLLDMD